MSYKTEIEQFDATDAALREVYNYYSDYNTEYYNDYSEDDYVTDSYSNSRNAHETYPRDYSYYDHNFDWVDTAEGFFLAFFTAMLFILPVLLIGGILLLVSRWAVFKKAGVDGWESLIAGHNEVVELKLGGIKTYWFFLNIVVFPLFIGPIILAFWKNIKLAQSFGKGSGFGVGLALLPYVFYPILAWGSAEYIGPQIPKNEENIFYDTPTTNTNSNYSTAQVTPTPEPTAHVVKAEPIYTPETDDSYIDASIKVEEPKEDTNPIKSNDDTNE